MKHDEVLMPAGEYVHPRAVGLLYNEIGRIVISRASVHGVDRSLWDCLRVAVDRLRLVIDLQPLDDDWGRSVKVVKIGKTTGVCAPATTENPDAIRLAEYLRVYRFHCEEDEARPSLRLGPPHTALNPTDDDHTGHLYLSLPRQGLPAAATGGPTALTCPAA